MEKWIRQEEIHKGKIFSLWGGQVDFDNGKLPCGNTLDILAELELCQ